MSVMQQAGKHRLNKTDGLVGHLFGSMESTLIILNGIEIGGEANIECIGFFIKALMNDERLREEIRAYLAAWDKVNDPENPVPEHRYET